MAQQQNFCATLIPYPANDTGRDQRKWGFTSLPDESVKAKQLFFKRWCPLQLLLLFLQSEFSSQLSSQLLRIVLDNIQATAFCWPTNCKGGNDELPPGLKRSSKRLDILLPFIPEGEEMKQGTIMPQAVLSLRLEAGNFLFIETIPHIA